MIAKENLITEELIKTMVHSFYNKVKEDQLIGPIFKNKIGNNWDCHLKIMCDFWSSVTLSTGRYKGRPMAKHIDLPNLNSTHFLQWLELFKENAYELFAVEIAEFFIDKAKKIAESLMQGIAFYRGVLEL